MNFWDSVKKFAQPYADEEYDDFEENDDLFAEEKGKPRRRAATATAEPAPAAPVPASAETNFNSKVLSTGSNKPGVVLFRPITFGDAVSAANDLRERKEINVMIPESSIEWRWEDMTDDERYTNLDLDGKTYTLYANNNGNHLHGGKVGFSHRVWSVAEKDCAEPELILHLVSPDGEEGYPGTLKVMVTYTFTDENELLIRYEAVSDKDTLCNLTNHTYFNLNGEAGGKKIEDHTFEMNCDTFTVVDDKCIPTGEQRDVTGTPFDFREAVRVGDRLDMTPNCSPF